MVNKVTLVGRLGKDPEVRHLENGSVVANLVVATSETYKDKSGERVEHTEWHNVSFWKGLADVAEKYLKKGDLVYIEGSIKTRTYEKDGETKYIHEIAGSSLSMLGSKSESKKPVAAGNEEDDLPW